MDASAEDEREEERARHVDREEDRKRRVDDDRETVIAILREQMPGYELVEGYSPPPFPRLSSRDFSPPIEVLKAHFAGEIGRDAASTETEMDTESHPPSSAPDRPASSDRHTSSIVAVLIFIPLVIVFLRRPLLRAAIRVFVRHGGTVLALGAGVLLLRAIARSTDSAPGAPDVRLYLVRPVGARSALRPTPVVISLTERKVLGRGTA